MKVDNSSQALAAGTGSDASARAIEHCVGARDTTGDVIRLATVITWLDRHQGAATVLLTVALIFVTTC
jgi:hypothetical protein